MNSKSDVIKVLVADDHAVVRQGINQILSKTPDLSVIDEAENGAEVLQKVKIQMPDVVVMDIEMPVKSGWEVLPQLKSLYPKLPVIILSIHSEDMYGMRFLKAGASAYLTKAGAPDQLVQAIRKVASGGKFISPEMAERLVDELGRDSDKSPHETLSPREFQVFCSIASGKSLKDIAEELSVGVTTVSTHRARILEKMALKSNAELIHYALKNKLVE